MNSARNSSSSFSYFNQRAENRRKNQIGLPHPRKSMSTYSSLVKKQNEIITKNVISQRAPNSYFPTYYNPSKYEKPKNTPDSENDIDPNEIVKNL